MTSKEYEEFISDCIDQFNNEDIDLYDLLCHVWETAYTEGRNSVRDEE